MRTADSLVHHIPGCAAHLDDAARLAREELRKMADPITELEEKVSRITDVREQAVCFPPIAKALVEVLRIAHEARGLEDMARAVGRIEVISEWAFRRLGLMDQGSPDGQKKNATPVSA
ncbi:MAG TPA: hypothetical protein VGL40_03380 [Bacillota bacterium]